MDRKRNGIPKINGINERAKQLRKNMTKEEKHLWYDFLSTLPVRFRRQAPIGYYVVDFYCEKEGLIIELDGSQHYTDSTQIQKDKQREDFFRSYGLTLLRYSNYELNCNFSGVCEDIYAHLKI